MYWCFGSEIHLVLHLIPNAFTSEVGSSRRLMVVAVAELPNLMSHRSACLLLDTKHSRENTKLLGSVGHTPGVNSKIHVFAIRITNERIKLTSLVTISYVTFNTTSEYNIY